MVSRFEEAAINGDPVLIREMVTILLDNALKFTNPGGTVSVNVGSDAQRSTLVVADTGIGIGERDLPRIFDRFYRARDGAGIEGAGLGLSIARWIADEHHAQIAIDSSSRKFRVGVDTDDIGNIPLFPLQVLFHRRRWLMCVN